MGKILVIGSSNTDLIARVKRFPAAGETIEGLDFIQAMGGKGANQAVAALRSGGDVSFITSLGDDANGINAMTYYLGEGLDISSTLQVSGVSSGTAMIWVDEMGENCIVITPGANSRLSPDFIFENESVIAEADLLVMQMEIPYETIKAACSLAHRMGKTILLNAAPARRLDEDLISMVDILVVNETEAETISGEKIETAGEEAVVDSLRAMGAKTVILTLGEKGCLLKNTQDHLLIPAFRVKAVDTTAAGDTFCGALAAELSKGGNWRKSLEFAAAAAAVCVTRMGAQPSIASEKEVRDFLNRNKSIVK